ncbi:transposase, IS66 family protein [Flammeovirgaceae bacterium 311]|nr:transposase, IS66 family protein [Flammeovirgaceae bacterium 311]AHM62944.1 transposase, IS66 family protein [Flammeovirgaceae bacterium 311]
MFSLSSSHSYLLYSQPCDMRKSFDALSGLVRNELQRDPASGEVYVFVNRSRSCIKLLHWESGGFVLYYKRLERGTFTAPRMQVENGVLKWPELVLMIEGIQVKSSIQKVRYQL